MPFNYHNHDSSPVATNSQDSASLVRFDMVKLDLNRLREEISQDPDRFMEEMRWFIWIYWMPFLCLFGLLTNLINVRVFADRRHLKTSIHICFLVHSTFELVYLSISFTHFLCKLIFGHQFKMYLLNKLFHFYIYFFLNSVIGLFLLFVEVIITLKRLFLIRNYSSSSSLLFKHKIMSLKHTFCFLFALSFLIHLPLIFYKKVKKIPISDSLFNSSSTSSTLSEIVYFYEIEKTRLGDNFVYKLHLFSIFLVRGIIVPIVFLALNRIVVKELRIHMNKRRHMNRLCSRVDQSKPIFIKIFHDLFLDSFFLDPF